MLSETSTITIGLVVLIAGIAFWVGKLHGSISEIDNKFEQHKEDNDSFHEQVEDKLAMLQEQNNGFGERLASIEAKLDFLIKKFKK